MTRLSKWNAAILGMASMVVMCGCAVCFDDTISEPTVKNGRGVESSRKRRSKAIYLDYADFVMSVEMFNYIPNSHEVWAFLVVPWWHENEKAVANTEETKVVIGFQGKSNNVFLQSQGVQLRTQDIIFKRNGEGVPVKSVEVSGGTADGGVIKAFQDSRVEIRFDDKWNPASSYYFEVRKMEYGSSTFQVPALEFTKGKLRTRCDTAP